jgi:hypothetical protein
MPSEASPGAWGISPQDGKLIATFTIILPIVTAHEGYSYAVLFLSLRSNPGVSRKKVGSTQAESSHNRGYFTCRAKRARGPGGFPPRKESS